MLGMDEHGTGAPSVKASAGTVVNPSELSHSTLAKVTLSSSANCSGVKVAGFWNQNLKKAYLFS